SSVKVLEIEKNLEKNDEKEIKVSKKVVKTNTKNQSSVKEEVKDNLMQFSKENEEVKENFKNELNFKLLSKVNQMNKVVDQIKNNFTTKFDGKISEMKVLLNPKSLGKIELKMTIEKGNVIAEFKVESMMVKQAIESNLQDLRNALSDKGYSLDGLNVSVDKDDQDNQKENDKYYENIFDDEQNEEKDESVSLIEESKLLNMMRRRAISYMG
ncbi:flagellar hook-length control protein FliK, partial [Clostridiaceae bacterium HSG29]|nr:flagellar hook-length control protein FliK [Clostridiaceae bacterium HSG29]